MNAFFGSRPFIQHRRRLVIGVLLALGLATRPASAQVIPEESVRDDGRTQVTSSLSKAKRSDSALLRLPKSKADLPPLVPPAPSQSALTPLEDPTVVEIRNVKARTTARIANTRIKPAHTDAQTRQVAPNMGLLARPEQRLGVAVDDNRRQVVDTSAYPWRTVVKMVATFPSGGSGGCSGAIIDDYHVLTAGHCVHDATAGGWADTVLPAGRTPSPFLAVTPLARPATLVLTRIRA